MTDEAVAAPSAGSTPDGYHTLTPAIMVHDANAAIEFYTRAFGARELSRLPSPDGQRLWHAELQIGDSHLMLGDEFPDMGDGRSPRTLEGTTCSIHIYVADADAAFQRALDAGATVSMPLMDAFWGDRYGKVLDPFGHSWGIASRQEEVSEEEMARRVQALSEQPA